MERVERYNAMDPRLYRRGNFDESGSLPDWEVERGRKAQEEIAKLMGYFPDLKAEDVPAEVWKKARLGMDLTLAYCLFRITLLEEMLLHRRKSEELSTGSMSSMGGSQGGTLAAFWDAYEV